MDAKLHWQSSPDSFAGAWQGEAETADLRLHAEPLNGELNIGKVAFRVESGDRPPRKPSSHGRNNSTPAGPAQVMLAPFTLALGKNASVAVQGSAARAGFRVALHGDAPLQRLMQSAEMIGLHPPQFSAEGGARVDLQIAGGWFSPAQVEGKLQLREVRAKIRGWAEPLLISTASLLLKPGETDVQKIEASAAGETWRGSIVLPRPCTAAPCPLRADLHADEIDLARISQLVQGGTLPWYRFLSPGGAQLPSFLNLRASGELSADRLVIRQLVARQLRTTFEFDEGKLSLQQMQVKVLGGAHTGQWTADFRARPPAFKGSGAIQGGSLDQLAALTQDNWVSGTASLAYQANFFGSNAAEFLTSAEGAARVEAGDGSFPHIFLGAASAPLQMRHLTAQILLRNKQFTLHDARLDTGDALYQLTGTASLARDLNLQLTQSDRQALSITGTLRPPHVAPVPAAASQARLKAQ